MPNQIRHRTVWAGVILEAYGRVVICAHRPVGVDPCKYDLLAWRTHGDHVIDRIGPRVFRHRDPRIPECRKFPPKYPRAFWLALRTARTLRNPNLARWEAPSASF